MQFKIYRAGARKYDYAYENMICDRTTGKTLLKIICLPEVGDL